MTTQDPLDLRVPYPIIPTDVPGVFISPPPPADFDPNTASRQSLIRNGFLWRRPEAGDDPALRAAWDRVFSRQWRAEDRVVPEFEPRTGKTHGLRNLRRAEDGTYTGDNWAGSVVEGDWVSAVGYWQVPRVTRPPSGSAGSSASWIGLDGFRTHEVLQAGVEQAVDQNGDATYSAWFSWLVQIPGEPPVSEGMTILNFPVNDGETIFCSVVYLESRRAGQICLANEDSGAWIPPMTLAAPQGATLSGSSAEWIMEAPSESPLDLPVFAHVNFTTAFCCSNMLTTVSNPGDAGTTVNITDAASTFTSVKTGWGTTTITYTGPA
jgi:Peptidase A4 family